jgi:hypothetical protein
MQSDASCVPWRSATYQNFWSFAKSLDLVSIHLHATRSKAHVNDY